jgi:hypothetical protein
VPEGDSTPPGFTHELDRAQRPRSVKMILEFVLVRRMIDAFKRRIARRRKERV